MPVFRQKWSIDFVPVIERGALEAISSAISIRSGHEPLRRHDLGDDAPLQRLFGLDAVAREQDVACRG